MHSGSAENWTFDKHVIPRLPEGRATCSQFGCKPTKRQSLNIITLCLIGPAVEHLAVCCWYENCAHAHWCSCWAAVWKLQGYTRLSRVKCICTANAFYYLLEIPWLSRQQMHFQIACHAVQCVLCIIVKCRQMCATLAVWCNQVRLCCANSVVALCRYASFCCSV